MVARIGRPDINSTWLTVWNLLSSLTRRKASANPRPEPKIVPAPKVVSYFGDEGLSGISERLSSSTSTAVSPSLALSSASWLLREL